MPYLNSIVNKFNENIAANVFSDKRFAGSDYNAIAYAVVVDNRNDRQQILPCIPTTVGEYKGLMFDDSIPLRIYHKIISTPYQYEKDQAAFGRNSGRNLRAVANMQMIILANRHIIRILPEDLETLIVTNFPDGSENGFSNISTSISGIFIKPGSSDLSYEKLWAQEFKGYDFNVNPDRCMLAVNYTIESMFKTKCFKLCDCAGETAQ